MAKKEQVAEDTTVLQQQEQQEQQAPIGVEPVNITVTDLQALVNLIDVASSRGAFRGPELTAVGTLYSKLAIFLQQVTDTTAEQQAAQSTDSAVTTGGQ